MRRFVRLRGASHVPFAPMAGRGRWRGGVLTCVWCRGWIMTPCATRQEVWRARRPTARRCARFCPEVGCPRRWLRIGPDPTLARIAAPRRLDAPACWCILVGKRRGWRRVPRSGGGGDRRLTDGPGPDLWAAQQALSEAVPPTCGVCSRRAGVHRKQPCRRPRSNVWDCCPGGCCRSGGRGAQTCSEHPFRDAT